MSNTLASMAYSEIGEIQTVSLQGSQIFVVIRLVGETLSDMMGNPVQCGQYLVGIPKGAPEHTATMAELLIPINMTYATQISDPKFLIGARVQVFFTKEGFPTGCILMANSDARIISRRAMFDYRLSNKDKIFDSRLKDKLKNRGILENFNKLSNEVYDTTFHKGFVGTYGESQNMFIATPSHMEDIIDFEQKVDPSVVRTDSYKTIRTKECYMPTTVFTGKT